MAEDDQPSDGPIVVIALAALGDFIRTHTLIRLLYERHPGAPIDVVGRERTVEIAALMPEVRAGIGNRFQTGKLGLKDRFELAGRLRRGRYRRVVVASRAWKAALTPFLAGIPERIGWFGEFRYPLINRPRFGDRKFDRLVDEVGMVGLLPGERPPPYWPAPRLVVPESIGRHWRATAEEAGDPHPILMLAPSAGHDRAWPTENFAQIAQHAVAKGWTVWVSGVAGDRPMAELIRAKAGSAVRDLTGTALIPTACQLAHCDAFVGNDSGLLHLSAALETPSVGVFRRSLPYQTAPINANVRTVGPLPAALRLTKEAWAPVGMVEEQLAAVTAAFPRRALAPPKGD